MTIVTLRRGIAWFVLLAILALLNYAGWTRWHNAYGPEGAVNRAIAAFRDRDADTFAEVVDANSLAASYFDQRTGRNIVDEKVRKAAIGALGRRLRYWVESHAGESIEWFGRGLERHGRLYFAKLVLQTRGGARLPLRVSIVEIDGRWRVAELLDVEQLPELPAR